MTPETAFPEAELTRLTSIVLAVRKPQPDSADRAEFAMVAKPELVHRLLVEIDRLKAAPFTRLDQLLKLLRQHHQWHLDAGTIGLPDGEGGWIEIDDAAEYSDSLMYEQTEKALEGNSPEDAGPMPRGGISAWWWSVGVLERRKRRALEKLVCELAGDLTDEGANYSGDGLHDMRRRVANALPKDECPEWLREYRDADLVQLKPGHRR